MLLRGDHVVEDDDGDGAPHDPSGQRRLPVRQVRRRSRGATAPTRCCRRSHAPDGRSSRATHAALERPHLQQPQRVAAAPAESRPPARRCRAGAAPTRRAAGARRRRRRRRERGRDRRRPPSIASSGSSGNRPTSARRHPRRVRDDDREPLVVVERLLQAGGAHLDEVAQPGGRGVVADVGRRQPGSRPRTPAAAARGRRRAARCGRHRRTAPAPVRAERCAISSAAHCDWAAVHGRGRSSRSSNRIVRWPKAISLTRSSAPAPPEAGRGGRRPGRRSAPQAPCTPPPGWAEAEPR